VAALFRTLPTLVFTDEDNRELAVVADTQVVPARGDNVRLHGRPYLVDRVGYDIPDKEIERIFIVCRPT
jgi:hypothetical protein